MSDKEIFLQKESFVIRKNFFMMFLFALLFATDICSAAEVRVSDYGVDGLVARYNEIAETDAKINPTPKFIEKINIEGYLYDAHAFEFLNGNTSVQIILLATPDGYVSKIMIMGYMTENLAKASSTMLVALGLNGDEYTNLVNSWKDNDFNSQVWCSAKQRYIRHEMNHVRDGIYCIILSAFKN